jgi:hypothetical protein
VCHWHPKFPISQLENEGIGVTEIILRSASLTHPAPQQAHAVWRASDHWCKRLDALDQMKRTGDFSALDHHFDSSQQELERKERDLVGRERQEEWECRKPEREREQLRRELERQEHERQKREYCGNRNDRTQNVKNNKWNN